MTNKSDGELLISTHSVNDDGAELGVIALNQPERMNPINSEVRSKMRSALTAMMENPAVRVVAFTGTGRAFSAGGDMQKYLTLQRDPVEFPKFIDDAQAFRQEMWMSSKPIIALVNGISIAGGTELILGCDFAIAAESASIGDAHLNFGQLGGGGVLALLPRVIGPARARELVFSGDRLSAQEALAVGLVNHVVPDDKLLDAAKAFAEKVAKKSPLAVANAKKVMNSGYWLGTGIPQALRFEADAVTRYCLTSEDAPEGLNAFAEKRKPRFTGR